MLREHYRFGHNCRKFFRKVSVCNAVCACNAAYFAKALEHSRGAFTPAARHSALRMRGADRLSGLAPGLGVLSMVAPILSVPMPTTCFSPFSLSYPHSFSFLALLLPPAVPVVSTVSPHKRPPLVNLLPGTTKDFSAKVYVLTHQKQCRANVQYKITYKLRWYPFL